MVVDKFPLIRYNVVTKEKERKTEMKHYLFEIVTDDSVLEGEEFLVGATNYREAKAIALDYFPYEVLEYHGALTDDEAECSGLDEY